MMFRISGILWADVVHEVTGCFHWNGAVLQALLPCICIAMFSMIIWHHDFQKWRLHFLYWNCGLQFLKRKYVVWSRITFISTLYGRLTLFVTAVNCVQQALLGPMVAWNILSIQNNNIVLLVTWLLPYYNKHHCRSIKTYDFHRCTWNILQRNMKHYRTLLFLFLEIYYLEIIWVYHHFQKDAPCFWQNGKAIWSWEVFSFCITEILRGSVMHDCIRCCWWTGIVSKARLAMHL